MEEQLVSVKEAARILGISEDTIRRWDKRGMIRAQRDSNNHRLFQMGELKRVHKKYFDDNPGRGFRVMKSTYHSDHKVLELFAGAGGLALGFKNAGLSTELLVEIDKNAAATLRKNLPNVKVVETDVSLVDFSPYAGVVDIVSGGFPCQAFSYAGLGRGFEDTRGTLFFEFARCVNEVKPKIAVAENVRGLLQHDNGQTFQTILNSLEQLGYNVAYKLLRAQFFDVPQKRERLIIIGVRKDLQLPIYFPKERDYLVTLREALHNCPPSLGTEYPKRKREIMQHVPPGGYWRNLPEELQKEYMQNSYYLGGGKTGMARRLAWNEPSLTLTTSPAQKQTERCHPEETRPLNIREYARLQTFPDKWEFIGSISSQYKQIGNAVPVNLAYHVGLCLVAMLEGNFDESLMAEEPYCQESPILPIQLSLF